MAITLMPTPFDSHAFLAGDHLRVIGDIEDTLVIPATRPTRLANGDTLCECYYIALSDGSMVRASNDPEHPDFLVVVPGAFNAVVAPDGLSISILGDVQWIALTSNVHSHSIAEPALEPMPLFN